MKGISANFGFLVVHDPRLAQTGALAEHLFSIDPVAALVRLRWFGECLARHMAERAGLSYPPDSNQADLLRILKTDGGYRRDVLDLFHKLRVAGNRAAHDGEGDHGDALDCLKLARQLGVWFHRSFADPNFKAGKFQPPATPADADAELRAELEKLKSERDSALTKVQRAEEAAAQALEAQKAAEAAARQSAEESAFWEKLASELEKRLTADLCVVWSRHRRRPTHPLRWIASNSSKPPKRPLPQSTSTSPQPVP